MSKTWGFFLVAQDMVLSHRAKFQLIINFSGFACISSYFYRTVFRRISIRQAAWAKGTAKILLVAQLKKHHKLQTRNSKMQIAQYKFGKALINSTDKQLFQICVFLKSMCLAIQSIILQNYLPLMSVATIKQKKHKNSIY